MGGGGIDTGGCVDAGCGVTPGIADRVGGGGAYKVGIRVGAGVVDCGVGGMDASAPVLFELAGEACT